MTTSYPHGRHRIIIRIRFSKTGKVRFVSHRDVARLFERALRRLRLPVAHSEGFSPRPKLSFGLALSVSHESEAEYLDVELTELVDLEGLAQALTAALPGGIVVTGVVALDQGMASLQQAITSCTWRIEVIGAPAAEVAAAVAATLASPELPLERVRKGKTAVADVRPAILDIRVVGPTVDGVNWSPNWPPRRSPCAPPSWWRYWGSTVSSRAGCGAPTNG